MKKSAIIFLAAVALIIGLYFNLAQENSLAKVYINEVIDGDTYKTMSGKTIRVLGVDCPEINWKTYEGEYYAFKAKEFAEQKILNKNLNLEFDSEKKDKYGRLLAYIYLDDGEMFNLTLLKEGYASLMIIPPNNKYEDKLKKTAKIARKNKKGIWNKIEYYQNQIPRIRWQKADSYVGKTVIVQGKIKSTYKSDKVTYLNFSKDYTKDLTVVIFNGDLVKFDYNPADYLKGKEVEVMGEIKLYKGSPEIILDKAYNISIIK